MNVSILGAGAWGTALATSLSARQRVTLWVRDPQQAKAIAATRCNQRYLPEAVLPQAVAVTSDFAQATAHADLLLLATPTAAVREVLQRIGTLGRRLPLVWACKGFEESSGKLPHQIAAEVLGGGSERGALSGPSFALEVMQGRPTALTLASEDIGFARAIARELHQPTLRVYFSGDLIGVEVGGAVKNVMAIATGICDGLALGLNARAALITRGLAELTRLGLALGGRVETFLGLAGVGDLILTCTGDLSRNRRVGIELAAGRPLGEILEGLGHVAEGVRSARAVAALAAARGVDMPITRAVCAVLYENMPPQAAVEQLLARDPRQE